MRPDEPPGEPAPSYELADIGRLVEAVHAAGARVAAHTTTRYVSDLIGVGVDSVEHGTSLEEADLDALAERGGAWTPTLCATFGGGLKEGTREWSEARERLRHLLPMAAARGVSRHDRNRRGRNDAREVAWLAELGLTPSAALAAASTSARRFLKAGPISPTVSRRISSPTTTIRAAIRRFSRGRPPSWHAGCACAEERPRPRHR